MFKIYGINFNKFSLAHERVITNKMFGKCCIVIMVNYRQTSFNAIRLLNNSIGTFENWDIMKLLIISFHGPIFDEDAILEGAVSFWQGFCR